MPTVTIGNNTGNTYSGISNAHLRSAAATYNYGGYAYGYTESTARYDLIKFTGLSNITGPVTVSSAYISMYRYAAGGSSTISLRRLLRNWIEGTQSGASHENDDPDSCCYNEYGNGNAWTSAGGLSDGNDRVGTASATMSATGDAGYVTSGDLSADTEDMINGDLSNYGYHMTGSGATSIRWEHKTATDGQRPYMTVTYTTSGGTGNSYYYQQQQM